MEDVPTVDVAPDPDDNFIIATALAGEAQYLVTGDKTDLDLEKVRMVKVRDFIESFD